jgi:hypothetical protein
MRRILGVEAYDDRMTDQPAPPPSSADAGPAAAPQEPPPNLTFERRFERFGQQAEAAGQRLGREAEDAGRRLAANPVVVQAGDTAARVWGLLLIAVGLWFFAEVTLGYDMPSIPWRDAWPLGLIVIGLVVIARGLTRRRA